MGVGSGYRIYTSVKDRREGVGWVWPWGRCGALNRVFQLEGTYKDYLVQLPDQFRADQKLKWHCPNAPSTLPGLGRL